MSGLDKNGDGQFNTRFDNDGARRALIIRQSSGLGLFRAIGPVTIADAQIEDDDGVLLLQSAGT